MLLAWKLVLVRFIANSFRLSTPKSRHSLRPVIHCTGLQLHSILSTNPPLAPFIGAYETSKNFPDYGFPKGFFIFYTNKSNVPMVCTFYPNIQKNGFLRKSRQMMLSHDEFFILFAYVWHVLKSTPT